MRQTSFFCLLFLILGGRGNAQEPAFDESHLQSADRLLKILDMEQVLHRSLELISQAQLQQRPELQRHHDVMRQFLEKYFTWETLKGDMIEMYAEVFTEEELEQLIAFYQTELGRKMLLKMPELTHKVLALVQQRLKDHQDELESTIRERLEEQKQKPERPPPD